MQHEMYIFYGLSNPCLDSRAEFAVIFNANARNDNAAVKSEMAANFQARISKQKAFMVHALAFIIILVILQVSAEQRQRGEVNNEISFIMQLFIHKLDLINIIIHACVLQ